MVIVPSNDNRPVVTLAETQLSKNETAPPILAFQDLTLSDLDYTPCTLQSFVAARVVVETIANDSDSDFLAVRYTSLLVPYFQVNYFSETTFTKLTRVVF